MAQEKVTKRTLSKDEIAEILGLSIVWNGAEKVLQKWGKIVLPGPGDTWHHRWKFSPPEFPLILAVDFYKEGSCLTLLDSTSGEERGGVEMPKITSLWTNPYICLESEEQQLIEFRGVSKGKPLTLIIRPDGNFQIGEPVRSDF